MTFSTRNEGFQVSFPNGYTVSIGTGSMHYCENHTLGGPMVDKSWESKDCEIAVVHNADSDDRKYVLTSQVEGYVTPLQFARLIEYVSSLPAPYPVDSQRFISEDTIAGMDEILEDRLDPAPPL